MTVDRTRVVVTGMGVMAPTGQNVEEYWDNLVSGVSGIGKITLCDASEFPNDIAGEVTGFDASQYANAKETRRLSLIHI